MWDHDYLNYENHNTPSQDYQAPQNDNDEHLRNGQSQDEPANLVISSVSNPQGQCQDYQKQQQKEFDQQPLHAQQAFTNVLQPQQQDPRKQTTSSNQVRYVLGQSQTAGGHSHQSRQGIQNRHRYVLPQNVQKIRRALQFEEQHIPNQQTPQVNEIHENTRDFQQEFSEPSGMGLIVPMRDPSPEPMQPVPVKPSVEAEEIVPEDMDIDIQVRNVVCDYKIPIGIDLCKLTMNSSNAQYTRENGMLTVQRRNPDCYVKISAAGKVFITGCRSESDCLKAARSFARHVQRVMGCLDKRVVIEKYRVNNILATCRVPFTIKLEEVAKKHPVEVSYTPEVTNVLVWRSTTPKATVTIYSSGFINVAGASSGEDVVTVITNILPILQQNKYPKRIMQNDAERKRKMPVGRDRKPRIKRERKNDTGHGKP